jgi:hypothetical protein
MKPFLSRRFLRPALMALALIATMPALPQTPARYTVEIVVFRNAGEASVPDAPVVTPGGGDDVVPTPVAAEKLGGAAARLRGGGGFQVLAHKAWTQGPEAFNSRRGVSAARLGLGDGITGKVMLERGQYLHFGVDLTIEGDGHRYRISEVRRVKPDEIHYFDHPAVGVIAIVTAAPATTGG